MLDYKMSLNKVNGISLYRVCSFTVAELKLKSIT